MARHAEVGGTPENWEESGGNMSKLVEEDGRFRVEKRCMLWYIIGVTANGDIRQTTNGTEEKWIYGSSNQNSARGRE